MNKKVIKSLSLFCVSILLAACGYFLVHYGKQNETQKTVFLNEKGNIDYEVCLKNNDFITKKCLSKEDKENTYIASLIDYLNLKYDYNVLFDKDFSGSYTYYFKATVKADKSDSSYGNYFTKEYVLSDKVSKKFEKARSIEVSDSVNIDYDYYNDILNNFKNTYGVVMDGKLDVSLEISVLYTDDVLNRDVMKTISLPVTIPLTSQVVEIPITAAGVNHKQEIYTSDIISHDRVYFVCKALGYTSFVISALFIVLFFKYSIRYALNISEYNRKIKKILRMYDGIIVNVTQAPELGDNVIKVASFDELIDAHSEVRMPINFIENYKCALFYLTSNNETWVYELEKDIDD